MRFSFDVLVFFFLSMDECKKSFVYSNKRSFRASMAFYIRSTTLLVLSSECLILFPPSLLPTLSSSRGRLKSSNYAKKNECGCVKWKIKSDHKFAKQFDIIGIKTFILIKKKRCSNLLSLSRFWLWFVFFVFIFHLKRPVLIAVRLQLH